MTAHALPTVAVIVGSLSKASINRKFAEALGRLAGGRLAFRFIETADLPLYDYELEADLPASVRRFKAEIEAADAVLFATPEYLRSVPAAMKNALEWGSRPWGRSSWPGKPAAIVGVTPGAIGTAVAQAQLRSIVSVLDMPLLAQPEIYFQWKPDTLDQNGELADEGARKLLHGWIDRFANWIARFQRSADLALAG
ncbi:MAG: NADPH-dependent FMN reductase [Hyphomonadaceae bacterium]